MEKRKLKYSGLTNKKTLSPPRLIKTPKAPKVINKNPLKTNAGSDWYSGDPYELGLAYLKNKNYEQAIVALKDNLKREPEDKSTMYGLGISYLNLEQFDEAINEFKQLLLRDHSNLEARVHLGTAYLKTERFENSVKEFARVYKQENSEENKRRLYNALFLNANQLFKLRQYEEAISNYNHAAELYENDPVIFHRLGLCYRELNNYDKAINSFEQAIEHYKETEKQLDIYNLIIELKIKEGADEEAIDLCNKVFEIDPENAGANFLSGEIYFSRRYYELALERYLAAVEEKPDLIQALINIGQIYVFKNELHKALNIYNRVLEFDEKNSTALCNISLIKYKQGDVNTALDQLSSLSRQVGENNYLVYKYLGIILLEKGMTEGALARVKKSIELNPDDLDNYINLGVCYHKMNELEMAVDEYEKVLEIDPDNLTAMKNLALLYYDADWNDEAIELYKKLVLIEPDYRIAYENIANSYRKKGEFEEAIQYYEDYLELEDKNPEVLFFLGITFFEVGMLDDATETFKKLLKLNNNNAFTAQGYVYLSRICVVEKDYMNALDYARKSVFINVNYVEGLIQYATILLGFRNKKEAKLVLDKILLLEPNSKVAKGLFEQWSQL
jgi:tetratricopeptide (TPR) repeat protein